MKNFIDRAAILMVAVWGIAQADPGWIVGQIGAVEPQSRRIQINGTWYPVSAALTDRVGRTVPLDTFRAGEAVLYRERPGVGIVGIMRPEGGIDLPSARVQRLPGSR